MTAFCDTSILVAASVRAHEHHAPAFALLERIAEGKSRGVIGAHSLAETYAVLTRLPVTPRIQPEEAARILEENIVRHFSIQGLKGENYLEIVRRAAEHRLAGGAIDDALLLACAEKAEADRIYTFNVEEFRRIAPHLRKIIMAP